MTGNNPPQIKPDTNQAGIAPTSLNSTQGQGIYQEPPKDSSTQTDAVFSTLGMLPDTYSIVWKGSTNFWSGRQGNTAVAIVDHIMEGSIESAHSWFKTRRNDASSHFGIARDGRIWQWVKVEDTAWANGIVENPDASLDWLTEGVKKKINPNILTISIEHEGHSGEPIPDTQYQASLWLHRYLCKNYNIRTDRQHIIGHYQITARSRANCPGPSFPWNQLISDLNKPIINEQPQTSQPAVPSEQPQTTPTQAAAVQPPTVISRWAEGVSGIVYLEFGPGTVNSNNSFIRSRPSVGSNDGTLLRKVQRGTVIRFVGYTDSGPEFLKGNRWYLISESDGGGWIHSKMIE